MVSPAMWDLLKNEDQEGLEHLVRHLHVLDLDGKDFDTLPVDQILIEQDDAIRIWPRPKQKRGMA